MVRLNRIAQNDRIDAALARIESRHPGLVSRAAAVRETHGHGESWHPPAAPRAVVFARTTRQIADVLAICSAHRAPVIPFGAGSSIEGQVHAVTGGISLDLSGMNAVLEVNAADMDCTVQAGVTRQRLNEELRATGLFFPVDLGAHATLGGMAATRASGTTTVRYGSMKDLVLSMTVVLPDGQIVRTGGRARKSAAGYDLTRLMIGAEGTLGVIAELTLRLFGIPQTAQAALASFPDMEAATRTVLEALACGLALNRIELADTLQMHAINRYAGTDLPEAPTLFLDLAGTEAAVAHDLEVLAGLAAGNGALRFERAADRDAYAALWKLRHDALWASRALKPGAKGISTDVCVPVSRLPECIARIQEVIAGTGILAPLVGHVGDGNFHLVLLFDPDSPAEFAQAQEINAALVRMAIGMGGTSTGEHGVGIGKKAYLAQEHGPALDLMRRIRRAIDPQGIMNPGKIFDMDPDMDTGEDPR